LFAMVLQLREPLDLRNESRVGQVAVYAANAFCKKSFFVRATLLLLGLVRAVNRSLKMQAISETPSQGCNVAPHSSSKRKN
jgi:hypothetical protein